MSIRKFFVVVLGVIANLGYIFFSSVTAFAVFRIVNGFMQGLIGSVYLTVVSDSLPPSKFGTGIGIYGLAFVAAQAFGPAAGTSLRNYGISLGNEALGFRFAFIVAAVCAAISLIPCFAIRLGKKTKEDMEAAGAWYKNIFSTRALPAAIMLTLAAISNNLFTAYIVPYGETLGIKNIGVFFTAAAITGLCTRPIYGRLGDRFGLKKTLLPGFLFQAISLLIVSRAGILPVLLIGAVAGALGFAAALPGLQAMGIQSIRRQKRGVASNTVSCGQDLGFFLSPFLGGIVYSVSDYRVMYLSGIIPCTIAAIVLVVFWPTFKRWKTDAQVAGETNEA